MKTETKLLLTEQVSLHGFQFKNRMAMAPMTRSRALGNVPNDLMAEYYGQRATAGLIITEGTSPSPNGLGYSRIPGIFTQQQIEGWKKITKAVHAKESKIFIQLMHTGRVAHPANMLPNARVVAPSAIAAKGQMWTDTLGLQAQPVPHALTTEEVKQTIEEYVQASVNAIEAGFDGIELHGANGYLIEQFLNPGSNQRSDDFGGSIENRSRFLLEIAAKAANAIGKEKIGVRFSPFGTFNDMPDYEEIIPTYEYLAKELNKIGILYLHVIVPAAFNAKGGRDLVETMRNTFDNIFILAGGYDKETAEEAIESGKADLIAFGRNFISNPDYPERIKQNAPLSKYDEALFYTPGEKGYTDYGYYNS